MQDGDIAVSRSLWLQTEGLTFREESDNPEALIKFLARNPGLSFVIEDATGRLLGSILCGHDGRRGFVYHLAVLSTHRRRRYGTALVDAALRALSQQGITRCHTLVRLGNDGAARFWHRMHGNFRSDVGVLTIEVV